MQTIDSIEELEALYDAAVPASLTKVTSKMTPLYRRWIDESKFVVLSTVGPEGADVSPRGDDGPVVEILDDRTILLPDWRGNNRIDSLRNIVRDGRTSLMFMVPGCNNVVRVIGRAVLTSDESMTQRFNKKGMNPKTVIVLTIEEMYFQCAKALMRSKLWSGEDESANIPSAGEFIKEMQVGFDAEAYDSDYPEYAKSRMW
ncbi:MAG: pyridoxamine 5'-phosphate oxidase family protein [Pikeienuella sp.]